MSKKHLYLGAFVILLMAVRGFWVSTRHSSNSMPDLIIGKWRAEFQIRAPDGKIETSTYEMEFVSQDILQLVAPRIMVLNLRSSTLGWIPNVMYQYEFRTPNTLFITSISPHHSGAEVWAVSRKGNTLVIKNSYDPSAENSQYPDIAPSGSYTKVPSIDWPMFALLLGGLIVEALMWKWSTAGNSPSGKEVQSSSHSYHTLFKGIAIAMGILAGMEIGVLAYALIRFPWDVILTSEVSMISLVIGIKMIRASYTKGWLYFLGVISMSLGIFGIFQGLIRLFWYLPK